MSNANKLGNPTTPHPRFRSECVRDLGFTFGTGTGGGAACTSAATLVVVSKANVSPTVNGRPYEHRAILDSVLKFF